MKLKTCPACKGAKEMWGMGFIIMEKCKNCHGIGHVPDIEDAEIDAILQQEPAIATGVTAAPITVTPVTITKPIVKSRKVNDGTASAKGKASKERDTAKDKTS